MNDFDKEIVDLIVLYLGRVTDAIDHLSEEGQKEISVVMKQGKVNDLHGLIVRLRDHAKQIKRPSPGNGGRACNRIEQSRQS